MSTISSDTARSLFVTGLRNAHALENQALSIVKPQIQRIDSYPEVLERLRMHAGETETQLVRLEEILSQLGEDHSTIKDTAASFIGTMAALGHSVAGDEILKNTFANFAFENYEIASYRALLVMAELAGAGHATSRLQASLREEEAMAQWLQDNIGTVVRRFVTLSESGGDAKS